MIARVFKISILTKAQSVYQLFDSTLRLLCVLNRTAFLLRFDNMNCTACRTLMARTRYRFWKPTDALKISTDYGSLCDANFFEPAMSEVIEIGGSNIEMEKIADVIGEFLVRFPAGGDNFFEWCHITSFRRSFVLARWEIPQRLKQSKNEGQLSELAGLEHVQNWFYRISLNYEIVGFSLPQKILRCLFYAVEFCQCLFYFGDSGIDFILGAASTNISAGVLRAIQPKITVRKGH